MESCYKVYWKIPQGVEHILCDDELWSANIDDLTAALFTKEEAEKVVLEFVAMDPSSDDEFYCRKA